MYDHPKIAVVGTGAIGAYYGAMLARSGQDVHFLFRSDYDVASKEGLKISFEKGEDFSLSPVHAYQQAESIGEVDIVLVALKTTANDSMPLLIKPLVGAKSLIVTMQNGMGNVERLAEYYPREQIMAAICFISLNRIAPAQVHNQFNGYISIAESKGAPTERTAYLRRLFESAGIKAQELDSLESTLWRKLCWNIPFNGLSIVEGGVATDVIVNDARIRERALALMSEIQEVASAYGYNIENSFLERQFELTEKMGPYKPSSLIDFLNKKPIELESIWGVPLRRAREKSLHTPQLKLLYGELKECCAV